MIKNHNWSQKEIDFLIQNYSNMGKLYCCEKLNKTEGCIRYRASKLKLKLNHQSKFFKEFQNRAAIAKIGKKRPEHAEWMRKKQANDPLNKWSEVSRKKLSDSRKVAIIKYGHPRGMLGKKQSPESIQKSIIGVKLAWKDKSRYCNSEEYRQKMSDRSTVQMAIRIKNKGSIYSRSKNGWYIINKKRFYFRSSWEVNYARYLEWLMKRKDIKKWDYEVDTFWFEKIRRGVRSYLPDFKVYNNDGSIEYHEVKGYMDPKSITKISRMALYYPQIKLIVIGKESYKSVINYERMYPEAKQDL